MNEILTSLYRASKPKEALASQDEFGGSNCLLGSDVEKFAELIIQECYKICKGNLIEKGTRHDLTYNDGVMDCAIMLKQHFGVK